MNVAVWLPIALLMINAVTYLQFADDKMRAIEGKRRIPESNLLTWALFGGSPAAYAARHRLRHKTRKQPFSNQLAIIATIQAGALVGLASAFI